MPGSRRRYSKAFRVLPVSLNYNSFTIFWKKIIIEFGEPIVSSEACIAANEARANKAFQQAALLTP
ncbi:MAG: hypothetical protein WKG06_00065 [Segetibacter sp.]